MILILSLDRDDSTTEVIKWICFFNKPFIRLNEDNQIDVLDLSEKKFEITVNKQLINLNNISAYWYRRGNFFYDDFAFEINNIELKKSIQDFLRFEWTTIMEVIHKKLSTISLRIGEYYSSTHVNKLIILEEARKCCFKIPPTIVTTSKSKLLSFAEKHKQIITKPLNFPIEYYFNDYWLSMYTTKLTDGDIQNLPEKFGLSLFQKMIKKFVELRVFYFHGEIYATAIFSQYNNKTKIDHRNFDTLSPSRIMQFALPKKICDKIIKLMKILSLDTGSLDLILTPNNEYYFLEINPIGQYSMPAYFCNYNISKRLAEYLCYGK